MKTKKAKDTRHEQAAEFLLNLAGTTEDMKTMMLDFLQNFCDVQLKAISDEDQLLLKVGQAAVNMVNLLQKRSTYRSQLKRNLVY